MSGNPLGTDRAGRERDLNERGPVAWAIHAITPRPGRIAFGSHGANVARSRWRRGVVRVREVNTHQRRAGERPLARGHVREFHVGVSSPDPRPSTCCSCCGAGDLWAGHEETCTVVELRRHEEPVREIDGTLGRFAAGDGQ